MSWIEERKRKKEKTINIYMKAYDMIKEFDSPLGWLALTLLWLHLTLIHLVENGPPEL